MTCHNCRIEAKRKGKDRKGNQRYQCRQCGKTFQEPREKPLEGMYLPIEKAEAILRMLLEGNSVSSVARLLDVSSRYHFAAAGKGRRKVRTDHGSENPQRRSTGCGMR